MIRECVDRVFAPFGLPAPPPHTHSELESCTIEHFYDSLEVSMEVMESCGRIWGEMNAKVVACALAMSFCALVPSADFPRSLGRSDLRRMKDAGFEWSSTDVIDPAHLPGLAKAIPSNFMQTFFKAHGPQLALLGGSSCCRSGNIFCLLREFCVIVLICFFECL